MRDVSAAGHLRFMGIRAIVVAVVFAIGLTAFTACYSPSPAPGLPCTSDRQCPDGQVCAPNEVCVASGSVHSLSDDSQSDFDDDGATLENAVISSSGYVESAPWMNHAMRVVAIDRASFGDAATVTWDELLDEPIKGQGYLYSSSIGWDTTTILPGLSLTKNTDVTILLEGQIFLDANTWKLELRADDIGFVDIAEPGTATYRRLMVAAFNTGVSAATYEAKVAGWYPVRMAMTNRNMAGNISLRGATGVGVPGNFDSSRMRAAVPEKAQGLVMDSFDSPALMHFRSSKVAGEIRTLDFGTTPPPDSGISTATAYSVRWSGQFLVEDNLDGFTITTEGGGHRVWIDGALQADRLASPSATSTLVALGLTPGWHDIVLDLDKRVSGSTSLRINALTGSQNAFDADHLRPVLGPSQRWLSARNTTTVDTAIPDPTAVPATLSRTLGFPNIAGTVNAVTVEYAVEHAALAELALSARSPTINRTLAAAGTLTGMGFNRVRYSLNPRDFAVVPGSTWVLTVADTVAMAGTGDLREVAVSVAYTDTSNASLPFAPVTTYTSPPRDLREEIVAFGKVTWELRETTGVTAVISLRAGATEEECLAAEWHPVDEDGNTSALPGRFVQYRVAMTTNGRISAALDSFLLLYYSAN